MRTTVDEQGRICLPKKVRDRHGDRYRVVELPSYVALLPIDDDPVAGLRDAVGDAFADLDPNEIQQETIRSAKAVLESDINEYERQRSEYQNDRD
jgi:bifunctional DNA-binding transcriptional regulator/antitoxin component of YhaV-PrlF toxin-antitoxin module